MLSEQYTFFSDSGMDMKYNRESDYDGLKKNGDKHHHGSRKRYSRRHGRRENESDSSGASEGYRSRRPEKKDVYNDDDRHKVRISGKNDEHMRDRWQSEEERKNASRRSPDEGYERIDRDRKKHDRDRRHQDKNRHREQERGDRKESYQSSDEGKLREKRHARRQREAENENKNMECHLRHDSEDERDKELHRKSEHRRNLTDKDRQRKHLDRPPHREEKLSENHLNSDASNLGKSGGVYIPPFKLARMMKEVQDKSSVEYQRLTWDALRKSINGLVNKVNATNIKNIIPELFAENLIRGRGLFCRSCMKSQMASPGFTDVFAALVAVVNTKFPEVGELLLRRIVLQLKRAYKRNDKVIFGDVCNLFSFSI